jgi:hypothetical protein
MHPKHGWMDGILPVHHVLKVWSRLKCQVEFLLGECVHTVFRIVSNMFLRQKFNLAFEPGPYLLKYAFSKIKN